MRGLSFYAHAVGTAAFPGLVLADGLGFSPPLGAFAAALVFAFGVERLARAAARGLRQPDRARARRRRWPAASCSRATSSTPAANVDALLFGSLLLTGTRDLVLAGAASAAALAATLVLGPRWLARGFDPASARALGLRSELPDALLLVLRRVRRRRLAHRDRRAARDRAVRRAGGHGAARGRSACPSGSSRPSRSPPPRASPACGSRSSSNTPPGPTVAVLGGGAVRASRCCARARRRGAALAVAAALLALAPRRLRRHLVAGSSGREVVATTTQIGDWTRAVAGDAARVHQILQPNTDPARLRAAPGRRRGGRRARSSCS